MVALDQNATVLKMYERSEWQTVFNLIRAEAMPEEGAPVNILPKASLDIRMEGITGRIQAQFIS